MSAFLHKAIGVSTPKVGSPDAQNVQIAPDLQIPKQAVHETKKKERRRDHTGETETGWSNQERLLGEQGEIRQQGRDRWNRFSDGRQEGRNFGSVQIDAPVVKLSDLTPPPRPDKPQSGWAKLDRWHEEAARFEEWGREHVDQIGSEDDAVEMTLEVPGAPRRKRGTAGKQRRKFTLLR